jgi:hypothetical protein
MTLGSSFSVPRIEGDAAIVRRVASIRLFRASGLDRSDQAMKPDCVSKLRSEARRFLDIGGKPRIEQ